MNQAKNSTCQVSIYGKHPATGNEYWSRSQGALSEALVKDWEKVLLACADIWHSVRIQGGTTGFVPGPEHFILESGDGLTVSRIGVSGDFVGRSFPLALIVGTPYQTLDVVSGLCETMGNSFDRLRSATTQHALDEAVLAAFDACSKWPPAQLSFNRTESDPESSLMAVALSSQVSGRFDLVLAAVLAAAGDRRFAGDFREHEPERMARLPSLTASAAQDLVLWSKALRLLLGPAPSLTLMAPVEGGYVDAVVGPFGPEHAAVMRLNVEGIPVCLDRDRTLPPGFAAYSEDVLRRAKVGEVGPLAKPFVAEHWQTRS